MPDSWIIDPGCITNQNSRNGASGRYPGIATPEYTLRPGNRDTCQQFLWQGICNQCEQRPTRSIPDDWAHSLVSQASIETGTSCSLRQDEKSATIQSPRMCDVSFQPRRVDEKPGEFVMISGSVVLYSGTGSYP
jgi:hypothetical protein